MNHAPILLVIVPLLCAPLCVVARHRGLALGLASAAAWTTFALAIAILVRVLGDGTLTYDLGGWAAPWGIQYRIDPLGAFVSLFVSGIGAVVLAFAPKSLDREVDRDRHYLFLAAYLLCLSGLLGITVTGDLFNVFVFLEISSLSSYALISMGKDRKALTSAFQYLILGTIGATFILIGVGLMYMMTGTLNMMDMAVRIQSVEGMRPIHVAFAFLTVGISLKMALFPLHLWLPNAYAYAPSVVTAFLAATATKVSVYLLLRFFFTVFGTSYSFGTMPLDTVLLPLSVLGIFVASTVAVFQTNVKRLLAYSSVAQIGYMVLGVSLASTAGVAAGIVHMFNHALMKGGLFLAMGCLAYRVGSVELEDLAGIGRRMPATMFAWVLGGLGLIGVPITVGFVSKWAIISASLDHSGWLLASLLLVSSLIAVVYVWRVVEVAYFRPPSPHAERAREAPLALLLPTWVLIGATIVFGLSTSLSLGVAERAAAVLLGGSP